MFYFQEKQNINLYKSSILDDENLIHSFTTRTGGKTPSPLETFSMGSAENPELLHYVQENRKKICEILGVKYENLIIPQQKHTDNIKIISSIYDDVSNCDGLITDVPELVLMLLFADCVPVIIYAPDRHVISVIHAGWRGTAKSIVKKALHILDQEFHADIKKIKATIGPAIGQCCYPVSIEVSKELEITIEKDCDNIFTTNIKDNNLVNVDLKKLNARQLEDSGVINIDKSDNCTCCMSSVFYSYRAEKGKTGRHAAIASLSGI
ncbi:MAG TPA: peptidoglycan editing factor PgeF [Cyanobacteria bacterium UBA9971]|nr:peptidoglycan editing factor PgeF [Cyanobacteria bacterium UBA9971]